MDFFKFLKKFLEGLKELVKTNKLCENCSSKGDLLESCLSKFKCRKDSCSQNHHTLLHRGQTVENVVSNKFKFPDYPSHCFKLVEVKLVDSPLLDAGSESTFVTSDISQKLDLQGKTQRISLRSILSWRYNTNNIILHIMILYLHGFIK